MSKLCQHCGGEMTEAGVSGPISMARKDWERLRTDRGDLEWMLENVSSPLMICHPCIDEAEKGPFVSLAEVAAEDLGISVGEWERMVEERARLMREEPTEQFVLIDKEDVEKALLELGSDR